MIPTHADELKLKSFKKFLRERGAEVLVPTNDYEVLRIRNGDDTCVLYQKSNGRLTWNDDILKAYKAFTSNKPWRSKTKSVTGLNSQRKRPRIKALLKRDGNECFFCLQPMPSKDITIEHLVPRTCGGGNHIANTVLAHGKCNSEAEHLSVMEKIKIRESNLNEMRGMRRQSK